MNDLNRQKIGERIHQRMRELELSDVDVSKKVKISKVSVGKWRKGEAEPTASHFAKLAEVLKIDPIWLATGQNTTINQGIIVNGTNTNHGTQLVGNQTNIHHNATPALHPKVAPLINWIEAGQFTDIGDNSYNEYLPYFGDYGNDRVYWLRIVGDSMLPDFKEGEFVLINADRQPTAGNYVAALKQGEEQATFKKYRPKGFDDKGVAFFHLVPSNEEYPIIDSRHEPFDVLGVAVERNHSLV